MYQIQNSRQLLNGLRRLRSRERLVPGVGRVVFLLGLTSFFTDISSEMVAAILPIYLVYTLGFTPLQYGVVDGLYQGAATVVRLASGLVGDRWRRHKEVAVLGYALSAFSRPLLLLAGGPAALSADRRRRPDRQGHPHRAARRADLAELARARRSGARSACTARWTRRARCSGRCSRSACSRSRPDSFDAIFIVSFCVALIGLAVLVLFVENPPVEAPAAATRNPPPDEPGP